MDCSPAAMVKKSVVVIPGVAADVRTVESKSFSQQRQLNFNKVTVLMAHSFSTVQLYSV
jgi:hypothetical protein